MDITSELLKGVSPYLAEITYHVMARKLELVAVDNPEEMNSRVRIIFPEVIYYSEDVDEIDDDLIDGVIGIHWMSQETICIRTDMREIVVKLTGKPYVEPIA